MAEQSRVEQILKSMLGLAEEIPKPQSRVEELLIDLKQAIEGGGSGDLTEIVGRISTLETDVGRIKMTDDAQNEILDELDENVVRKTDYASSTKAGIASIQINNGIGIYNPGGGVPPYLYIVSASENMINAGSDNYRPLVSSSIQHVMNGYGIKSKKMISDMQSDIDKCPKIKIITLMTTTTENGNIDTGLSINDTIVLSISTERRISSNGIFIIPYTSTTSNTWYGHCQCTDLTESDVAKQSLEIQIAYYEL